MKLFQKDAVEWLKTLPSGSVDLLITDPPFREAQKNRDHNKVES
jgi:site-specific DNA-methyltransferase (adenine-specific)